MAVKPVLAYPNKVLRARAIEVSEFDDELRTFAADLIDTMEVATGAGLAAQQIGAKARMFVVNKHVAKTEAHLVFVNPVVESTEGEQRNLEGCLSFHGEFINVTRPLRAVLNYRDLDGDEQRLIAEGYFAQAILHEVDHLNGRLLIDNAPMVKKSLMNKRARKLAGKSYDYRAASHG